MRRQKVCIVWLLSVYLALCSCTITKDSTGQRKIEGVGEDATIVYVLEANKPTLFFIDGTYIGCGRRVPVSINKQQQHEVVAEPKGCSKKSETIRPPYVTQAPLRFTWILGECGPAEPQCPDPTAPPPLPR